jgi:hypothetical protein
MSDASDDTTAGRRFKDELTVRMLPAADKAPIRHAVLIHNQAMTAIQNFHSLYVRMEKEEGASSQNNQDILRAMLLFACSGLDAVVKQLIQDALKAVLQHDEGAQRELKKFAERRFRRGAGSGDGDGLAGASSTDISFLAESPF